MPENLKPVSKFSSRKWRITQQGIALFILVPILYKMLAIETSVTLTTLGLIGSATAFYGGFNIMSKKWGLDD